MLGVGIEAKPADLLHIYHTAHTPPTSYLAVVAASLAAAKVAASIVLGRQFLYPSIFEPIYPSIQLPIYLSIYQPRRRRLYRRRAVGTLASSCGTSKAGGAR